MYKYVKSGHKLECEIIYVETDAYREIGLVFN